MIRVLVVDDSALMRKVMSEVLSSDPQIDVVATASDPLIARKKIKEFNPDLITLDIEMPKLNGLDFLEKIMRLRPMPVLVVSAFAEKGSDVALKALELGAIDFATKPTLDVKGGLFAMRDELIGKVKAAAAASFHPRHRPARTKPLRKKLSGLRTRAARRVVAIGASTGGVYALTDILSDLPADAPPILITQHISGVFVERFAQRLDISTALSVTVATNGKRIMPGHAYLAPPGQHLILARSGGHFLTRLVDSPPVGGHRPSVDALFSSVAECVGAAATGILLTGMGKDGAKGLLKMRNAGAMTICQNEATSLIYGMPRAAVVIEAADVELPLDKIAGFIINGARSAASGKPARMSA
ncbi:MAG: chemotaxis response regulator protein-glutamate methylesterase [Alphaproteobacteria bacterium]|nr:MAG: chemotaxis response regulator protein-glutamate methylesterase [Alphaproteobacteria bacterium]